MPFERVIAALLNIFTQKGDLAHGALFLWAVSSTILALWVLKQWIKANARFNVLLMRSKNSTPCWKMKDKHMSKHQRRKLDRLLHALAGKLYKALLPHISEQKTK